jgi:hypothetical protein
MKTSPINSEVTAFKGQDPTRSKTATHNIILE